MNDDNHGGRKLRRGSARWRQQQRKERQLQQQREKGTRRTVERQVNPADGFKLPEVNLPPEILRPVGFISLAIVLVFGMIFLLRLFNPPEDIALPNGVWLGTEWSYDLPDDEAVTGLVERMRANRMGTAYVQTTIMKADRTWGGKAADINPNTGATINTINPLTEEPYRDELAEMEPNILRFLEQYNTLYPEGRLFAWVIFPADVLPLDDRNLHTRLAELSTLLVTTYGFDGVYLDIVPVESGDEDYLQMLRTVRLALDDAGDGLNTDGRVPLALAIPPDYRPLDPDIPFNPNYSTAFAWDRDFKKNVAVLADELHVQAYNSGLSRAEDYSVWVAYQALAYASAVAELGVDTEVLLAVPTHPAELPFHDPSVENIQTAVEGVQSGLLQAGESGVVLRGLNLFVEWTTDDTEWVAFQSRWVDVIPGE
ncbi:MAG: hypothetical protein AAF653_15715 [Chloroflexota bacterium]